MKVETGEESASTIAKVTPRSSTAEVRAVLSDRRVRIAFGGALVEAAIAVPGYEEPRDGDRVLAMTDDEGATWIVGVVSAPRTPLLDRALEASRPTVVHDARGRLIFEYDPETDRAVLHVADGDLEIEVPRGALKMRARDGVEVDSPAAVAVRGGRVELEAGRGDGPSARVAMQPGELTVVGAVLTAAADRAELLAARVAVKAQQLESHVDRARHVVKVLDVRAGRVVERAKDVYREVSGLSQTRAGRLKLVAEKAASLVGENTLVKARDRMKVKGERIHLA